MVPTVASCAYARTALAGTETAHLLFATMLAGAGLAAGNTTLIAVVVVTSFVAPSGATSDAENTTAVEAVEAVEAVAGAVYANGAAVVAPGTAVPLAASETKECTVPTNAMVALYVREATSVETTESAAVRSESCWS